MKKELGIFGLVVAVCVILRIMSPAFMSEFNLQNVARLVGIYGILGIGMGVVIITGGIDLSVGAVFALQGVFLVYMLRNWHWPWPMAVAVALIGPMILGWLHGLLVTRVKLQPFIVTLCGLLIYRGLARFITNDSNVGFGSESFGMLGTLAKGKLFGVVPMAFVILLVVAGVMWVVLHWSVYGRYLFAVGRNEAAARYSGINSRWVIISAYMICSLLAGVSGILNTFYSNSLSPADYGNFYELYAIAAAVLGGCSLFGGEGSVIGIVLGAILLRLLANLVNLLGVPSSLEPCVTGVVILVAVLIDQVLAWRHQAKRKAKSVVALAERAGGAKG